MADLIDKGVSSAVVFETARETVVKHYQWMLRHDFLPRIVDPGIVDEVFTQGRTFFEPSPGENEYPTMPIEFSVAAYRLGHSMVRGAYNWNRIFDNGAGTLRFLFQFTGTSGILSPPPDDGSEPEAGFFERLPTNWIADFRRLFDFGEAGRDDLVVPAEKFNLAKRIDPLLVNPLADLPLGSFGGRGGPVPDPIELNLAFRNLTRANMMSLATGQQMAQYLGVKPLAPSDFANAAWNPTQPRALEEALRELSAVVLHPPRGRGERKRAADGRRRAHRRRGVPPRHGRQPSLPRA